MTLYLKNESGMLFKFEAIQLFVGTRTITAKYRPIRRPNKFSYFTIDINDIEGFEIHGKRFNATRREENE